MMLFLCIFCILCSCSSEPEVREYRIPKNTTHKWEVPTSWNRLPHDGLRAASFTISGDEGGGVDISVIYLQGGGDHLENTNRWRGEIGLPPLSTNESFMKSNEVLGVKIHSVDITNSNERIFVSFVELEQGIWFFKMRGSPTIIEKEKSALNPFILSFLPNITPDCNLFSGSGFF